MDITAHFSLKHYEHMVAVGAFSGEFEKNVELLRGQIVDMAPLRPADCHIRTLLTEWSYEVVSRDELNIHVRAPIRIPVSDSEPQPDLTWVRPGRYWQRHPEPSEVLLLVTVGNLSLEDDRGEKLGVYAEAGIADYWIVNLIDQQIEVYRNPVGREYQDKSVFRGDSPVSPLALPTASLQPSRLFSS